MSVKKEFDSVVLIDHIFYKNADLRTVLEHSDKNIMPFIIYKQAGEDYVKIYTEDWIDDGKQFHKGDWIGLSDLEKYLFKLCVSYTKLKKYKVK